jgi:hypothetical protein
MNETEQRRGGRPDCWVEGTSVPMIERHYGTLLDGATEGIAGRLDALDAERDEVPREDTDEGR